MTNSGCFQNRKVRCKIKQLKRDNDILKACYDSLAKHERHLSEWDKLDWVPILSIYTDWAQFLTCVLGDFAWYVLTLTEKLLPATNQNLKYNSKGDETMSSSTALVSLANGHYLTNIYESFGWWVQPSKLNKTSKWFIAELSLFLKLVHTSCFVQMCKQNHFTIYQYMYYQFEIYYTIKK